MNKNNLNSGSDFKIKKAVILVAGFGTRFLPATKAQPKEMLTVVDKPIIQYLVEEAVASGIEEIIFVTGRGKRSIEDHFDHSFELEYNLVEKGKHSLLEEIRKISKLAKFSYVRQPFPFGDGHAILCAKNLTNGEPFAVMFGDDIVYAKTPCLKQLISVYKKYNDPVVALEQVLKKDVVSYGVISSVLVEEKTHQIKNVIEKPSLKEAPSNLIIVGKYVLTPDIFNYLERLGEGSSNNEIRLSNAIKLMLSERTVYGLEFEGKKYDCGNKLGLLKAQIEFGLRHPEIKKEFKKYLKGLFEMI